MKKTDKKNEILAYARHEEEMYMAPTVELIEVRVERGFAASDGYGDYNAPGNLEEGPTYEF